MALKRKQQVGSFTARDAQGNAHTVIVIQSFINAGNLQNPHPELPGLKEFRTSDGRTVTRIERGKYRIVDDDVDLVSDDPSAV